MTNNESTMTRKIQLYERKLKNKTPFDIHNSGTKKLFHYNKNSDVSFKIGKD